MKILVVHNFYQSSSPSGEDVVFKNEVELLRRNGVEVITYTEHNDRIKDYGLWGRLILPFKNIWSAETYRELKRLIKKEKPNIAHFHNIWYLISPSAYYVCREFRIPVIQSIHNQRIFCPKATIYRDGTICTLCYKNFFPWPSVKYACYCNSRLKTAAIAFTLAVHKLMKTWIRYVDTYIVFTKFFRDKFIEWGLPAEKIVIKPHFVFPDPSPRQSGHGEYGIFIGRLSVEKGIRVLLSAWKTLEKIPLKIIGSGNLMQEVRMLSKEIPSVQLISSVSRHELLNLIKGARFLVWPSLGWYENFGLVAIEAFACGVPVIASRIGAMEEIVKDKYTGLLFECGNPKDLADKIKLMIEHPDKCIEMGKNARAEFEAKYTAEKNFEILMKIYEKVIGSSPNNY